MPPTQPQSGPGRVRDHALGLQRFVGGVQVFGGTTLVAAYSLGATSLRTDVAPSLLVAIGFGQIVLGLVWLVRPRLLRTALLRHPGTLVAFTLGAATAVTALGGSGVDRVYITSVQCWLIAAGCALPGYRWAVALALSASLTLIVWALVDAGAAGFEVDGALLTAAIGLLASVGAGLWMGRTTGAVVQTMSRWHVVEVHELGVVRRLRGRLDDVDAAARGLAAALGDHPGRPELSDLAHRLRHGLRAGAAPGESSVSLEGLLARLSAADPSGRGTVHVQVDGPPDAGDRQLSPVVAAAVESVVERQLANVTRHAPQASVITIRAEVDGADLRVAVEDDGGGGLPFRAGTGTRWSERQLARVGGSARYFAGEAGVGFSFHVPLVAGATSSGIETLSVDRALTRFGANILGAIRWAGYVGDSLSAYVEADAIGWRWLLMPLGAVAIELVIRGGVSHSQPWSQRRLLIAAVLSAALAAVFVLPAGSPDTLIPATTSVIIPAHVLYFGSRRAFLGVELLRLLAVAPLLVADLAASAGLLLVYPAGMYLIVRALRRFMGRARDLEERAADAAGRASLAAAAVRGLTLQHDALDVLSRSDAPPQDVVDARRTLERALAQLSSEAAASLDPRAVVSAGLSAALGGASGEPVAALAVDPAGPSPAPAGAIDRITLVELAALVADERASCAPPGALGRRRLDRVEATWNDDTSRDRTRLTVIARPSLRVPDPAGAARVSAVAETLGIDVQASAEALTLTTPRV